MLSVTVCPISWEMLQERRQAHREHFNDGTSWFLDIVVMEGTDKGKLIGCSGFEALGGGEALWSIIVHRDFQRRGVCTESYAECVNVADSGTFETVKILSAVTGDKNERMIEFCSNMGMEEKGEGAELSFVLPVNDNAP